MRRSPWIGYSVAPFTAPLLYGIIILFFPVVYEKKEFSAGTWLLSVSIFIFASYVACFIAGVPLIIILKKIKKLTYIWLAIIGSFLYALIINVILFWVINPVITGNIYRVLLKTTLTGLAMGMVITMVFSYFAGITFRSTRHVKASQRVQAK